MKLIPLTQSKFALVDDDIFEELNKFKWCVLTARKTFYAQRQLPRRHGRRRMSYMHREVFRLKGERVPRRVDHKDRNGLNNQWNNLRGATGSQQNRNHDKRLDNTSGYIGVSRSRNKWEAHIGIEGKKKYLGLFADPFSAAWVRDEFAKVLDPEFAATNNLVDRRQTNIPVSIERRSKSKVKHARARAA